ncbi:MAG TPA: tRNA pseudouridine(55) synthase TruB [Tepidisphaeraceae bacterium]
MTDLNDIHGVLNLDKPPGITSAVVVARVKRLLGGRAKVGHAGTLDSFATGVLLILVGRATKRCEELMGSPKQYETTIRLGAITPTLDPLSPPEMQNVSAPPSENEIIAVLSAQTGDVLQTPPLFSALKVDGRRASDRTRDGEALTLPPRPVRIDAIDLLEYVWPDLRVRIDCGRGTYVRSIARDVGQALGVGGYLTQLRRTRVGPFSAEHAVRLDNLTPADVVARLV